MRTKEAKAAESLAAQIEKEGKAHRERMDSLQRENDERIREIELDKQKQLEDIRRRHREGMLQLFVAHVIACANVSNMQACCSIGSCFDVLIRIGSFLAPLLSLFD